jgi:CxxC motif-containing protein
MTTAATTGDGREVTTHGYLCIGCPLGCRLEVDEGSDGDIVEVRGFSCRKGRTFAVQEHTDPRRLVTTTVAVDGGRWPRLPVRTVEAVPKDLVRDVCRALATVHLHAPVAIGDVVLADVCGTGIDVVATRDLPAG